MDQNMLGSERRRRRVLDLGEKTIREMEEMSLHNPHICCLYHSLLAYPEGSASIALWTYLKAMANTIEIMQKRLLEKFTTEPGRFTTRLCSKCGQEIISEPHHG